jgi:HSP20 family protein
MASRYLVPFSRHGGDPLFSIYREMNRMFDDVLGGSLTTGGAQPPRVTMPSLDVQENGDELCVAVELPGVKSEDVDVRLDRDVLTISGEKKVEQEQQPSNYHVMERSYGRFSRSLQLPFQPDPDQVSADYENGVLKVRLKRQPQQQGSRRIEVRSGQAQGASLAGTASSAAGSSGGMDEMGSASSGEGGASTPSNGGYGHHGAGQGGVQSGSTGGA